MDADVYTLNAITSFIAFTSDHLLALAVAPVVLAIPTSFPVMLLGMLTQRWIVMLPGQAIVGVVA